MSLAENHAWPELFAKKSNKNAIGTPNGTPNGTPKNAYFDPQKHPISTKKVLKNGIFCVWRPP